MLLGPEKLLSSDLQEERPPKRVIDDPGNENGDHTVPLAKHIYPSGPPCDCNILSVLRACGSIM
jgi:hypothetical protein